MDIQIIEGIERELNLEKWYAKGGPGSGHWGHRGRKGRRGGSAPSRAGGKVVHHRPLAAPGVETLAERRSSEALNGWLNEGLVDPLGLGGDVWANATDQDRADLKAQVARDLAEASGVTEQEAADFVGQWAHSSNDDDMRSLAIQQDAAKEFGVKTSDFTQGKIDNVVEIRRQHSENIGKPGWPEEAVQRVLDDPKYKPLMESDNQRAILRSMYNETQAELKSRGIKEVRLYRGVGLDSAPGKIGDTVGISTNAIESWSVSVEAAIPFANQAREAGQIGSIFEAVVPAERVLSTPATGFGCLTEGEVVTLGGVGGDIAGIWGLRQ